MDACIGCHSCEVGLRRAERPARRAPRGGGSARSRAATTPTTQRFHLSMSCNHCLEPACLEGCPTNAYEKLDNGVVAHHADDCIGCQYCTWNCPYSVPAFQPDRRIVTKCDMCLPRLEDGLDAGLRRRLPDPRHHRREGRTSTEWRADHSRGRRPAAAERRTSRCRRPASSCPHDVPARDLRGQRLEPAARAPALAARVADARSARSPSASAPPPSTRGRAGRSPPSLAGRRAGRRAAPPRPPGHGVEGAAQPAPLVAEPRGRAAVGAYAALAARRRASCPALAPVAAVVGAGRRVRHRPGSTSCPGRPAWNTPLTIVRFFATALGARAAAHRARRACAAVGVAVALAATAANWCRLGRGRPTSRGGARCASSCGWFRPWTVAALVARRSPASSPRWPAGPSPLAFVLLAVGELIGRWLFYVTVVPLEHARLVLARHGGGATDEPSAPVARCAERLLGVDHGGERYTLRRRARCAARSAPAGPPTRWVRTTCGYCSVGCGMLLGVRDGQAVAVQGDPDHPVNRGRLCPKGLSEHQTIARRRPAHRTRRSTAGRRRGTTRSTRWSTRFRDADRASTGPSASPCCRPASS